MNSSKLALIEGDLIQAITSEKLSASLTEPIAVGSYLEAWFNCLRLSKLYIQNCRTGIFPSARAYDTYCLFGSVENQTFSQWWHNWGFEKFRTGFTSLRLRLIVQHRVANRYGITLDLFPSTTLQLAGLEFRFWVEQIRKLNDNEGLLSCSPMTWTIYKSRISIESICMHLEVLEAYENIIRNSPSVRLWRIGEQMHLNPKAMTRREDTPNEKVEKHIAMGQTTSHFIQKGQRLVRNACEGKFPRFF